MIYIDCHICLEVGLNRRAADGRLICSQHEDRIWHLLNQTGVMLRLLADPYSLVSSHEPRSDYTLSLPPCNLDPIVVTDPRSRYLGRRDLVSAPRVLRAWSEAVAEYRSESVSEAWIPYLQRRLPWISGQPPICRFARHIAAVHHSLRRVTRWE